MHSAFRSPSRRALRVARRARSLNFFDHLRLEPGSLEHLIHFRRRTCHQQEALVLFHLAPILEKDTQSGGTQERDLAEVDVDALGIGTDGSQNFQFELIGAFTVNATGHQEFVRFSRNCFADFHNVGVVVGVI